MTIQSITIRLWLNPSTDASATTASGSTDGTGRACHCGHAHGKHRAHGRSHIEQALNGIDHQVRDAIKDALRDMDELPEEGRKELVALAKDFHHTLQDIFTQARGHKIDRESLTESVQAALQDLLSDLEALRARYTTPVTPETPAVETPQTPAEETPVSKPADPVTPTEPATTEAVSTFAAYA